MIPQRNGTFRLTVIHGYFHDGGQKIQILYNYERFKTHEEYKCEYFTSYYRISLNVFFDRWKYKKLSVSCIPVATNNVHFSKGLEFFSLPTIWGENENRVPH